MSTAVSSFITRVICEHQGCLDYKQLHKTIRQSLTVPESMLFDVLGDTGKFVVIEGKEQAGSGLSADSLVIAKTSLKVCQNLPDTCDDCGNVHLCRYFVCGKCKFGNKCKNSHDLDSAYNREVLRTKGLQDLQAAALFQLLLQNDSYLLPEICSHYNKGNGEHGSCKYKSGCNGLHVCQHFLQDDCRFGATCKRAHTFDSSALKILSGRGVSPDNMRVLHKIYRSRFTIAGHADGPAGLCIGKKEWQSTRAATAPPAAPVVKERTRQPSSSSIGEADSNEICLFFIRRHCSFKEKCIRVHYHLPYRWQARDGTIWKDLPDMEDVEQAYCDPANSKSKGISHVDFLTMTSGAFKVRRLSTASSVSKPPNFILTTEWLWCWKNDQGKWFEFGSEAGDKAAITAKTLENVYLADIDSEITFSAGRQHYILNFKGMFQQNIKSKAKREVRRRPRFVSGQEVEKMLKSGPADASSTSAVCVPDNCDRGSLSDFTYELKCLSSTSVEFLQVKKLFRRTMSKSTIHSIQRIQNPSLLRVFQWQKEEMQKKNGGKVVEPLLLFHGMEKSLTAAICEQNFDWRICGVHGVLYGKGSYFARDASYSDRFSKSSSSTKTMFVVKVLAGEYTKGNPTYLRPPVKGASQGFYDSCVDSVDNPTIFVVFEKHQIYPEYIIEYSP